MKKLVVVDSPLRLGQMAAKACDLSVKYSNDTRQLFRLGWLSGGGGGAAERDQRQRVRVLDVVGHIIVAESHLFDELVAEHL